MASWVVQWVEDTVKRTKRARGIIDASIDQFAPDESGRAVMDMLNVNTMVKAEMSIDDMARRSLGLKDVPDKEQAQGSPALQAVWLAMLYAIKAQVAINPRPILDITDEELDRISKLKIVKD